VRRLLAAVALVSAWFVLGASPAYAEHCGFPDETGNQTPTEEIFHRHPGNLFSGTEHKIRFRFRTTCSAFHSDPARGLAWSTAHVRLGGDFDSIMEIGWWMFYTEAGDLDRRPFTEFKINGVTKAENNWHSRPASCLNPTESDVWRVRWVSFESWALYMNCIDGVGYRHLATYGNAIWTFGIVMGETGRRGGTDTHMADEHRELRRYDGGSWTAWTNNSCYHDFAAGWKAVKITDAHYDVDWGAFDC